MTTSSEIQKNTCETDEGNTSLQTLRTLCLMSPTTAYELGMGECSVSFLIFMGYLHLPMN